MGSESSIALDDCVLDLLIDHPQLLGIFQELGIEYTCGGKSLRTACEQQHLPPGEVIRLCGKFLGESFP